MHVHIHLTRITPIKSTKKKTSTVSSSIRVSSPLLCSTLYCFLIMVFLHCLGTGFQFSAFDSLLAMHVGNPPLHKEITNTFIVILCGTEISMEVFWNIDSSVHAAI